MDQTTDAGSMSEMPSVPTKELAGSVGDIKPLPAQHSSRRRDSVAPLDRREAHLSIEDNNFSASKAIGAPLLSSDPTPFSTKLNIPTSDEQSHAVFDLVAYPHALEPSASQRPTLNSLM